MNARRALGIAALPAVAAALMFGASPASAFQHPVGTKFIGGTGAGSIQFGSLTACRMSFTGHVTISYTEFGGLGGAGDIDSMPFSDCVPGTSVTANIPMFPGSPGADFGVDPVGSTSLSLDLNITTRSGTCHYTGGEAGVGNGVSAAPMTGSLTRRTAGCGGPGEIDFKSGITYSAADGSVL